MGAKGKLIFNFGSVLLALTSLTGPVKLSEARSINIQNMKRSHQHTADGHRQLRSRMSPPIQRVHHVEHLPLPQHPVASQYETLSVVMDTNHKIQRRFIQVQSPPSVYPPHNFLQIEYDCSPGEIAGVEVHVLTAYDRYFRAFHHHWTCSGHSRQTRKLFLRLNLPDSIVYRADYLNREVSAINRIEISVWILSADVFHKRKKAYYAVANTKARYNVEVLPPYSRPRKNHIRFSSLAWDAEIMLKYSSKWNGILQCVKEKEVIDLMTFPMAYPSMLHGLSRDIPPYQDQGQRLHSDANINNPKFTISAVLYVVKYCQQPLCSLVHRKTHYSNMYVTPLIFMNQEGKIFIQVEQEGGEYSSMINGFRVPLRRWIQLVYVHDGRKWSVHFFTQMAGNHRVGAGSAFGQNVHYNETNAFYHLGGSGAVPAFSGYMLSAKLWRGKAMDYMKVPSVPFFELNHTQSISLYHQQCDDLHRAMERVFHSSRMMRLERIKQVTCQNSNPLLASVAERRSPPVQPYCHPWQQPAPRRQLVLWRLLRRAAATNESYATTHEFIGHRLYLRFWEMLHSEGLAEVETMLPWLRQSSCYGNSDSTALLATIYTGGLGVKMDESKALIYWLVAAQGGSQLAMLVLAHRHHTGLDPMVPLDMDYAYRYYYHVAQETIFDRTRHAESDVSFEAVRLTDAEQLKVQTGEKGDYFKWLKHQARQGVADAQINLARMYYHGMAGVQRDMEAAAEFYRLNAAQNLEDPIAQYDYAVILLRGQGTEQNEEKGLEYLNRSAALGHGPAYTALGWYKLNIEQKDATAADYFEKGDAMGHRDAAHNLGFMYLMGRYPGQPVDRMKAFHYYLKAAKQDHWDSAAKVAEFYNQGNERMVRDNLMATAWARYVAEKNRDIAWALRRGLDAYLKDSWSVSLVYYTMAAEAGLEVAQYNAAVICEELDADIRSHVHIDCAWKYWKRAVQATSPHITSVLKVADYHWYGYNNETNRDAAISYYILAARSKQPQALFNLAYLVENGVSIPEDVWEGLGMSPDIYRSKDNVSMIAELYRMCRDGFADGFFPCGLALLNLQFKQLWSEHSISIQLASAAIAALLTFVSVFLRLGGTNNHHSDAAATTTSQQQEGTRPPTAPESPREAASVTAEVETPETSAATGPATQSEA